MKRTNTWANATETGMVNLDFGDGLETELPLEGVASEAYADKAKSEAITSASLTAQQKADTAREAAKDYTDTVVSTSHLALDTDGTPYFSFGSMTLSVHMDTDGNPFFLDA